MSFSLPTPPLHRRWAKRGAIALGLTLAATPLALAPPASASSSGLVVAEVYGGGGNSGAPFRNDFVELQNTSAAPMTLDGMSVQYRSASGTGTGVTALSGVLPAGGHWLVSEAAGADSTAPALPSPDNRGSLSMSGTSGIVFVASTTAAGTPTDASVVDLVGYGSGATAYEGSGPTGTLSNTTSASRSTAGTDTDDNAADLTTGTPGPQDSGGTPPTGPPTPTAQTIEEIQGTGATSPFAGKSVLTHGVVTAAYPTGGLRGFTIQTPGTGGDIDLSTHQASDGLFVYLGSGTSYPQVGDDVSVQGAVSEYAGLTELTPAAGGVSSLSDHPVAPRPATVAWPSSDTRRESLESMMLAPQGHYTVTDNYSLNRYAEIGLARGRKPLPQPTDVARPGAAADAVAADNAGRLVTLDDGASIDFLPYGGGASQDLALPYLSPNHPVRVGSPVRFTRPVVVDYRNNTWSLQPTEQVTAANESTTSPVRIPNTRPARPERVGGDLKIASFNVLNYFTETGADWVHDGGTCSYYDDRDGNPVTDDTCSGEGPRGAADDADLRRQQAKIVSAVNTLGADVLSLEEIENGAKYDGDARRDEALATLVTALNKEAGRDVWSFVRSPKRRPAVADEDVIRTAFIYRRKVVRPVGASRILVGNPAFDDAREPLAQEWLPRGGRHPQPFVVIVNHFKSKGSGVDDGTGQGAANPDRVAQAKGLVTFAKTVQRRTGTRRLLLVGDFNSYTEEDPMQVLYGAGYTDVGSRFTDESTYLFDGVVGSLDHVLANQAALGDVTGADVWNINSPESVAFEYSRFNDNATDFYAPNPFRASDHDPLLVGFRGGG